MKIEKKIIYAIIRPFAFKLFGVFSLMMLSVVLEAFAPWPFKFIIDNVLGNEVLEKSTFIGWFFSLFPSQQLLGFFIVFVFFFINLSISFVEYFRSISIKRVIKQIIFQFSKIAFSNMEHFDIGFFRKQEVGDYIYRLSYDVSALGDWIEEGVLPLITSSLYLVFTTIIMFFISVKLTLISLAALPFLAGGLYLFNRRIEMVSKRSEYWNSTLFSYVQEALSQLKIIQAFSQEKKEAINFNKTIQTSLKTDIHLYRLNFLLSLLVGSIIAISYSLIIGIGINYYFTGDLSTGLLIIFIFYLDNLTTPLLNIIYASTALKEARVKIERMKDFFANKSHTADAGIRTEITDPVIEFKNVSLIGEEGIHILNNVNLTIPAGKMTVIVGVSGSGKTSLISLIPRLINEPTSGKVQIGGHDIREYDIKTLRDAISLVPQENILFNEKIHDIIAYGKTNSTMQEIEHAAKLAIADEFIKEHPNGYNFRVGEDGNYLSGGQRQRLMLARAFLKQAQIYILDEPLSMLDIQTRSRIWHTILEVTHGKTSIIVTNILDVINRADQIIFISKGKVVEAGSHKELLQKSNLYKLMISSD